MELQTHHCVWLVTALVLLAASLVSRMHGKEHLSFIFLAFSGFAVYMLAALLVPFLNTWDEQYHALVAKNMLAHPFRPTLYETDWIAGHDYITWSGAHIWLHKQPWFLWQIALSFKIFGVSELSLRLPSAVMCTLLILIGYRCAALLTDKRTAYCTAISITFSWFLARLASGLESVGQNDVCFIFYICASLWAFCEYRHRLRSNGRTPWPWIVLVGLFSGAAILTKWLVGLLVYLVWGFFVLFEYRFKVREWRIPHILLALGVTLLIVLPWQIHIIRHFPEAALNEYRLASLHLTAAVEGHSHPQSFYLAILPYHYFGHGCQACNYRFHLNFKTACTYMVLLAGLVLLMRKMRRNSHRLTLVATLLFVLGFFTAAKTKMPAFTFILCLIGFMSIGAFADGVIAGFNRLVKNTPAQKIFFAAFLLWAGYYQLNVNHLLGHMPQYVAQKYKTDKRVFEKLGRRLPENCYVFGANGFDGERRDYSLGIFGTFYSGLQCYSEELRPEIIDGLAARGCPVAVFDTPELPAGLRNRPDVIVIPDVLLVP